MLSVRYPRRINFFATFLFANYRHVGVDLLEVSEEPLVVSGSLARQAGPGAMLIAAAAACRADASDRRRPSLATYGALDVFDLPRPVYVAEWCVTLPGAFAHRGPILTGLTEWHCDLAYE